MLNFFQHLTNKALYLFSGKIPRKPGHFSEKSKIFEKVVKRVGDANKAYILSHRGILPTCHCDERSEEAIQEKSIQNKFANCNAGKILNQIQDDKYFGLRCKGDRKKSKCKGNVFSWIASLSLAMTPFGAFRDDNVLNKKSAFTLAEVLITLGIIGIVAAMTLPGLLADFQERVWLNRFKQTYAMLSNAYILASDEYGYTQDWAIDRSPDDTQAAKEVADYAASILLKYMQVVAVNFPVDYKVYNLHGNVTGDIFNKNYQEKSKLYALSNGTLLQFRTSWAPGNTIDRDVPFDIVVDVDVNGTQKPNTVGKDIYILAFAADAPKVTGYKLWWVNQDSCSTTKSQAWTAGGSCASWVIGNWNLDYLHREISAEEWKSLSK